MFILTRHSQKPLGKLHSEKFEIFKSKSNMYLKNENYGMRRYFGGKTPTILQRPSKNPFICVPRGGDFCQLVANSSRFGGWLRFRAGYVRTFLLALLAAHFWSGVSFVTALVVTFPVSAGRFPRSEATFPRSPASLFGLAGCYLF